MQSTTKAEEEQETSEKLMLNDNDFDSESDGECPHLIGKDYDDSDSFSGDSDEEEDCKFKHKRASDHSGDEDVDSYSKITSFFTQILQFGNKTCVSSKSVFAKEFKKK